MVIHFKRLPEYYSQAIASKFFDLLKAQVVGLLTVKGDDAFFEQGRPRPFEIANALEKTLSLLPPKPVHVEGKALLAEIFMHVAESYLPTTPEALAKRHVLFNEALLHNPQDEHLKQHSVGAHITLLLRLAGKVCSLDEVMALRGQDLRQHPQAQVAKQHILSAMRELFGFTDTFSSRNFLVKEEKGDWVTPPRQGQQHRYRLFSGSTKDFPVFDDASVRKVTPPEGAGRPTAPTPRRGSVGG